MAPKKYARSNRERGGGHEVVGVALVIVSAILLLCIVVPPILSDISRAIRNVALGLLGFSAYPVFLCTLILGVALIQNRSVNLSAKHIVSIAVMAVCALLILQLATSYQYLRDGFNSYISSVYSSKTTAGGLLLGVIAYGIQAAITPVFTYIVLGLGMAGMLLLMTDVFGKVKKGDPKAQKGEAPASKKQIFVKGQAQPHPVQPIADTSLFVGTIQPPERKFVSEGGNFRDIAPEKPAEVLSGFRETQPAFETYGTRPSISVLPENGSEDEKRRAAREFLFGGSSLLGQAPSTATYTPPDPPKPPAPRGETQGQVLTPFAEPGGPMLPPVVTSAPEVKDLRKPPKIVHSEARQEPPQAHLQEVAVPPPKDFSDQFVGGEIVNGDDLSRRLAEESMPKEARPEPLFEKPVIDRFDLRRIQPMQLKPIPREDPPPAVLPETPPADIPPIMNGDYFVRNAFDKEKEKPPVFERREEERAFRNDPESRFNELFRADRAIRESAPAAREEEFAAREDSYDLPADPETQSSFEKTSTSFRFEEEVEDKSETSFDNPDDHTGYYNPVDAPIPASSRDTFDSKVSALDGILSHREKPVRISSENQIKIDDYVSRQPVEAPKPKKKKHARYNPPPLDLLLDNSTNPEDYGSDYEEKARILEQTLESLKLPAKVVAITRGPAVTRYELEMPPGISVKRIDACAQDIEYNLASNGKIRIETPIPGKRAVGIEVPNEHIAVVALRDIIGSKEFNNASSSLTLALGKDISGTNIVCNLEKMPHLLIAGATGSGKSACLNSIIMSILYKASPDDVRLILIDPKQVEFVIYRDMPHLLMKNIINETDQAINAFKWAKTEMDRRYKLFSQYCVRNLQDFNNSEYVKGGTETKLPNIVIIVDELCELMMSSNRKELEDKIMSMAQKARAAGIHLILATQRPSVDVITGTIKANLPSRIAFAVTSIADSRTILDQMGAESLLGRGDMLYSPLDANDPKRVQGAYVTSEEVSTIVSYVKEHNDCDYDEAVEEIINASEETVEAQNGSEDDDIFDPLMPDVVRRVIESGQASTSMIQRRFSVGYARASRIIDQMEMHKFIGPLEGSKPREVYISREQFKEIFGEEL